MPKKLLSRDLLVLSILSVITVFTWIGFEVYRALTKTEIPIVLQRQIQPLNPVIQKEVLDSLRARRSFSVEELVLPPPPVEVPLEEESPPATESGEGED